MNTEGIEKLLQVIPQEASEAYEKFPFIEAFMPRTDSDEWDNRTTIENAVWLLELISKDNLHKRIEYICPLCHKRVDAYTSSDEITF
jgi:hypothetical protein